MTKWNFIELLLGTGINIRNTEIGDEMNTSLWSAEKILTSHRRGSISGWEGVLGWANDAMNGVARALSGNHVRKCWRSLSKTQRADKEGLEGHAEEFSFYPFGQWFPTCSWGEFVFWNGI